MFVGELIYKEVVQISTHLLYLRGKKQNETKAEAGELSPFKFHVISHALDLPWRSALACSHQLKLMNPSSCWLCT